MAKPTYTTEILPRDTIIEVAKFNKKTGEFVGLKEMTVYEYSLMYFQKGFRYQAYKKKFSQFKK